MMISASVTKSMAIATRAWRAGTRRTAVITAESAAQIVFRHSVGVARAWWAASGVSCRTSHTRATGSPSQVGRSNAKLAKRLHHRDFLCIGCICSRGSRSSCGIAGACPRSVESAVAPRSFENGPHSRASRRGPRCSITARRCSCRRGRRQVATQCRTNLCAESARRCTRCQRGSSGMDLQAAMGTNEWFQGESL